jgi:hypothetical protein
MGTSYFRTCNWLRRLPNISQSLQSIIGATLTFLCVFRMFAAIQKVIYQSISAVLLWIVTRDQPRMPGVSYLQVGARPPTSSDIDPQWTWKQSSR